VRRDIDHWKARRLDLSALLAAPRPGPTARISRCCRLPQELDQSDHRDHEILSAGAGKIDGGYPIELELPIRNTDRAVGARLSGAIAERYGSGGLVDNTIRVKFTGSAGQSFGAFLAKGVTFTLEGDANDYLGKGLSGGRIIVYPPRGARFKPEENIIVGNVLLYGATAGSVFIRGLAGERFAVRNSGATAVVEGVGDHGCEYMTGGVVVVLGPTGRNFAAGMSGGMAYVFDYEGILRQRCNTGMVDLEPLVDSSDVWLVRQLIQDHIRFTRSELGLRIHDNWNLVHRHFVKVMPTEYKRVLEERRQNSETTAEFEALRSESRPFSGFGGRF
jgi:glutamate synthase (NADPH/NADH) large chain